MARKNGGAAPAASTTGTALATASNGSVTHDALAGVIDDDLDLGGDGLEELGAEDVKIAAKVWNFKGVDADENPIPPNVFYDTVDETTERDLDLALLTLSKTSEWREYDEAEGRSRIRCRSFDRVTGTTEAGQQRACQGCPDAQWRTDDNGKRSRNCGPIYNVFAVDRATQQPCVMRFKRTSLPVIQGYLNKHHIGRRVVAGKRGNYPLFSFQCTARLKMSDDKKYAIPVLDRGDVLSRDEIMTCAESAKFVRDTLLPVLQRASDADTDAAGLPPREDASFNAADFADDGAVASEPSSGAVANAELF